MNIACYDNRELSWLKFNERVLEEAEDERVPLCERLSFLSIFQSNLDEFFMVRIGSLHDKMLVDDKIRENKTHMTAKEQIDASLKRIRELCIRRDKIYAKLMKSVKCQGVGITDFSNLTKDEEKNAQDIFLNEFFPLLSPFIVGKRQTFPFLKNKEIYAVALLSEKGKQEKDKQKIGVVQCTAEAFPRVTPFPGRDGEYLLSEDLIFHYLHLMFPGYKVMTKSLIRVTRNADIDADSFADDGMNYRDHMAEVIKRRSKLCPVRIQMTSTASAELIMRMSNLLNLESPRVFLQNSPLDIKFVFEISDLLRNRQELFYAQRHPQSTPDIDEHMPVIPQILDHDVLLHYPYQSIRPFLRMLSEAAHDPEVVSIKMTLYRLARDSKVVESLVEAAENGKQVDVLVELKARFDEENNIEWSRRLERAGCHVIYGIDKLKVHSKLCLITRKNGDNVDYITQIGTGNYNEKTSRIYTDLSLITSNRMIGEEAGKIFQALMLGETVDNTEYLLVAPHCLQNKLIDLIDEQINVAQNGGKGYIRLKLNSLTDKTLIDKLIEASQAGVKIDMVIRGICCLVAGINGFTDNIHIISIVGRFLEHSRIYIFGEDSKAKCYISSADWMTRNTLRRVEVATPVLDRELCAKLEHIFDVLLSDNIQSRVQKNDGTYVRLFPGENDAVSAQEKFYDEAYDMASHK